MNRHQGHIKHWNHEKGYGFIARDGADDVFVHISQLAEGIQPRTGLEVRFALQQDDKGRWQAQQVEALQDTPATPSASPAAATGRTPLQRLWSLVLVFAALILAAGILWKSTEPFYTELRQPAAATLQQQALPDSLPEADNTTPDDPPDSFSKAPTELDDQAPAAPPGHLAADSPYADNSQLQHTLQLIGQGGPYPYRQDDTTFQNREGLLPQQPKGYYREYTVDTPGASNRGARRVVTGGQPPEVWYYTDDHYSSFQLLDIRPLTDSTGPQTEEPGDTTNDQATNDDTECNNPVAMQLAANSPHAGNAQLQHTLQLIGQGGPYPYRQDDTTFQNREGLLPQQPKDYYREYTVDTPGVSNRGTRRVVTGGQPPEVWYYTDDHYSSFSRLDMRPVSGPLPPGSPHANNPQLQYTLNLILQGGPYPYRQDDTTFQNRERLLPQQPKGYYREYTVDTPGASNRGARRVITGGQPPEVWYYTLDHYASFEPLDMPAMRNPLPAGSPHADNAQLQHTIKLILQGGPYPYVQDNGIFHNRERLLPQQESGYYRQYTVDNPESPDCNKRRVVTGGQPPQVWYYTEDHYRSFNVLDVQP